MNSKYKLLSTLVQKTLVGSTNYASRSGICLQSGSWYSQQKFSPQSLLKNLSLSNHCGCYVRSSNAPVLSSSVISRHYASAPPDPTLPGSEPAEKKLSLYQRFKIMYRDYWYVLLPVHLVTSAGWLGGFYYMASSGVDIVALLEHLNFSDKIINPLRNGHATTGYIAIAYALYKIATPVRYTVTLGGTTLSINYLKKWGYIKPRPVPSKEKLKEMYEGQKEILKGKGQTIKDNMMQSLKPSENMSTETILNERFFKSALLKSDFKMQNLDANFTRCYSTRNDNEKSIAQQLKVLFRKYRYVVIPVHVITSVIWYIGCFLAASKIDLVELMKRLHCNEEWINVFRRHTEVGTIAVTYALFHLLSPLRYAVTLGCSTLVKNYLKRQGVIKSQKKNK